MTVMAFIQARMSSNRLPGKVLKPILNVPMILRQIERMRHANTIDRIVVLTSLDESDDVIEALCLEQKIAYFRGDLNDVLDRYYKANQEFQADHIISLTADCPLIDWKVIDVIVTEHLESNADYTSNVVTPTYPDGLDVEVMTSACLEKIYKEASKTIEREHVTYYCYQNKDRFHIHEVFNHAGDYSNVRWTVDNPDDLDFVTKIYQDNYPDNPEFTTQDIYNYLQSNPEVALINSAINRNEGLSQ